MGKEPSSGSTEAYLHLHVRNMGARRRSQKYQDRYIPITNPIEFISWRSAQEQRVLVNPLLNGVVIRPSLLYGRSGSLLGTLFKTAEEGRVAWFGEPDDRWALIHADDLAELYVLVAEKAQLIGGKVFDAANDFTESVDDILKSLARLTGVSSSPQYLKPTTRE